MSDPNGHSLLQRFEAWKVGFSIFKEVPFTGVGTGDLKNAFNPSSMFRDSNDFSVLGSNPVTNACAEFIIERISPFESVINFINLPGLIFAFSF